MATNFVARVIVTALLFYHLLSRQTAWRKGLLSQRKNTPYLCLQKKNGCLEHSNGSCRKGRKEILCVNFIIINYEKRNKIYLCQLPSHSFTLSNTSIPTRLYGLLRGHSGAQVIGKAPTKHLPQRPLIKSQSGEKP